MAKRASGHTYDPPLGFYFKVSFALFNTIEEDFRFQSVSGLSSEIVTESYHEGGQNQYQHELPVRTQYPDLVLKRGLWTPRTQNTLVPASVSNNIPAIGTALEGQAADVQQWCQKIMVSLIAQPTDIRISLKNAAGKNLMTWHVIGAWPKKWEVSDFNAETSEIVTETMTLHYNYFYTQ